LVGSFPASGPIARSCGKLRGAFRLLPMLNGFAVRLVVPGKFGVYWTKHLTWIRALTKEDSNF